LSGKRRSELGSRDFPGMGPDWENVMDGCRAGDRLCDQHRPQAARTLKMRRERCRNEQGGRRRVAALGTGAEFRRRGKPRVYEAFGVRQDRQEGWIQLHRTGRSGRRGFPGAAGNDFRGGACVGSIHGKQGILQLEDGAA
jgi:hypothetical protein